MNNMMRSFAWFFVFLLVLALAGGCGGGGGGTVSITDSIPGQPITQPDSSTSSLLKGDEAFNSGNYANAVFEFQQALMTSTSLAQSRKAYEGLGWALAKNGKPIGGGDVTDPTAEVQVIETFEAIGDTTLKDWTNQEVNDARVGLAFAYLSRNSTGDVDKAKILIQRIDPAGTGTVRQFNPHFSWISKRQTGVTGGMVHALYAYTCFLTGDLETAKSQIEYAYQREPQNSFITEMRTNLTLLGLFQ